MLVVTFAYGERRRSHVCPRSRIVKIFGVDIRSEYRTSDREIARRQVDEVRHMTRQMPHD